jgi:hypothetical protein
VVEVGVREKNGVDAVRIERKGLAVPIDSAMAPLEEAAIEQKLQPVDLDEVAGAGDCLRRAAERDLHRFGLPFANPFYSSVNRWSDEGAEPAPRGRASPRAAESGGRCDAGCEDGERSLLSVLKPRQRFAVSSEGCRDTRLSDSVLRSARV